VITKNVHIFLGFWDQIIIASVPVMIVRPFVKEHFAKVNILDARKPPPL
jgi:hypothetical protein